MWLLSYIVLHIASKKELQQSGTKYSIYHASSIDKKHVKKDI